MEENKLPEKDPEIGVFLCDCGGSISRTIDFAQLVEFASKLKDVKLVKRHSFLCGDEGRSEINVAIEGGMERIVVAACSPKLYETLFRQYVRDSGLNPYFLEMANIREQCAWPHLNDREGANDKAKRVVAAAIGKTAKINPIEREEFESNTSVLVIGAGVAGLQAAIEIADFGYEVHLIERSPIIGGNAFRLGMASSTDDGVFCISSPDILTGNRKGDYRAGLLQQPKIKIHTLSEVKGLKGSFGNFSLELLSHPRGVKEDLCNNCGKCVEVCPIEVPDEMNYGWSKRKAIYLPSPNAIPSVYVIDWKSCTKCGKCVEVCATKAIDLEDKERKATIRAGAIIVATGLQEYDPSAIKPYEFGVNEDVITQLQLARILDPSGPTDGKLTRPSDGKKPKKIVMIQCVGSRDEATNPYCSKICCTTALKHAILIKERMPDSELYICYMDIRPLGKDHEGYYTKARQEGVRFIRGKPSGIFKEPNGNLIVEVEDTFLNRPLEIETDMVVLSSGLIPATDTADLAEILGIEVGDYGFIKEVYAKLKPIETNVKGIYVCGGAQAPKDIFESITQAEASAFRVVLDLSKKNFERDMDIAFVKVEDCDACELCVEVCPYNAIVMVEKENAPTGSVARIDEASCDRCGACMSRCPTGAIQLRCYTDDQVLSQLSELLSKNGGSTSPKIVAFCCDECGYATVDVAGMGGKTYSSSILPIRVPCLAWVSLYQIFKALEYGADGILLVGCMLEKCQHLMGDVYAAKTVEFAKNIMEEIGLNSNRLGMVSVCAADPAEFVAAVDSTVNIVKDLESPVRG
ncbi:MAG: hydrogenase iron-sulfur subunit [Candidatus Hodarchaeota archaeon]